ncbi:Putative methionine and alanine importer, small subunit [Streptomyces zhaozhouensis]|uniref:Methionine and alanine importer, small subunit n=1 Tax=Streptomyces zhaozhouensis TaxID=1300267 RepID=A0A286E0S9_9ACTN|nr:methionine/alanine import family NSS transporter small subunit [Streptomyces zhaozhouensis]SOD64470.1 Putative methionine and alanine importer, small subunit [Streptomyces zhaozhouensis]
MSASAIVMMIVAMLVVWGGLLLAVLNLRNHPDAEEPDADEVPHQL